MFLDSIIQRRLASLLQPWLREEPELEVKLGFINSQAVAKDLRFDTSVLNQLFDEPSRLSFKEVTVERLSFWFSNWYVPAFKIELQGVHVTLSPGEVKEEGRSRRVREPKDTFSVAMKKKLSMLDPEGSALHDILERIFATKPSRNRFNTSFFILMLKYCQLQMHNISLNVEFPILNDSFMYFSEIKEFNAESQCLPHGCLARGIFGAIFIPLKKITCIVNGSGFEIGCKGKDQINRVLLSKDLFAQINLDDLHLVDFILRVPELSLFFSPADVSMYSALGKISPKEPKHARDGRQLWKLAASKVGHGTSAPRFSLHKLVIVACLWLHYVNAYEHILSLIGYPANHFLERSCTEISKDKMVLSSVCYHWKLIADVEKELPAEAISQARRVARYRAASSVQCVKETNNESVVDNHFKFISKILHLLAFILKLICNMFLVVAKLLCLRKVLAQEPKDDGHCGPISEDPYSRSCFILNLGKILITICPMEEIQPSVNEKLKSHIGISYSDLLSFSLSIDKVLLVYGQKTCEQSFFLSCGQLKINSSSSMGASLRKVKSENHSSSIKQHRKPKERVNNLSILWSEPAQKFLLPETSHSGSGAADESTCRPILENFLEEMWLSWERACVKFEESHIAYSENPSLLCEIKNFLIYSGARNPYSGSLKCSLILGKLNLALEYSSILSIYLLLRHTQGVLSWAEDRGRARILSDSSRSVDEQPEIRMDSKYNYNCSRLKTALLRVLPEKNVQLGILITGPHIRMSLRKEFDDMNKNVSHTVNQDDFHLAFDVHNIEVAVWPTSRTDLASLVGPQGSDDAEKKCLLFKEPHIIDIPKSNNEKYVSHGCISLVSYLQFNGLNAYVEDSVKVQQSQILESKPMTLQLSSFREYVHSFGTAIVAFSAALCGTAMGFSVLSYMDELYVIFQVVGSLSSAVSDVYGSFDLIGPAPQEYIRQEFVLAEPEKAEITAKGAPLIYDSILFRIHGTFKLKSVDMVIHVSRMSDNVESSMRLFDALAVRKLAETGLSDCGIWLSVKQISVEILGKEQVEVLTDLSGVQSVIFRYQNERGKLTDHSVLKDLLLQSLNCLYEISLSNCIITLWLAPPPEIASSSYGLSNMVENSSMKTDSERSTHWLVINVELGEISMARSSLKNVLVGPHQLTKLQSSLSVGGEFQTISWRSQGGILFLETTALAMFTRCFASYLHCATHLFSLTQSSDEHEEKSERDESGTQPNDNSVKEHAQKTLYASLQAKKQLIKAFLIDVSQFSLVLVVEDESSGVREFILEVDMKFELANMRRKFKFDLSRLSIFSQVLHDSVENQMQIPHFSSVTLSGDSAIGFQHKNENHSVNEASCSSDPVPQNKFLVKNCASKVFRSNHQNHILKQLCASMAVEKQDNVPLHLNQVWVGSGLVSGFDMTISLSEIQMILSTFSSLSGLFGMKMTSKSNERHRSSSHELENSMEEMVPNGAIVAIQDVHQHMYFTVESGENKYSLVGAVHYSLVGERALFRVNYHHQRIWKSQVVWFSLISLHAKNDLGEPLRLNCSPGSGFVDISSTNDRSWALWRLLSCEPKSYKGDIDWEPYNQLVKRTFYLMNKQNDCAVAFVNGIPEFVRKPGNPFKLKVFHDLSLARDAVKLDSHPVEAPQTSLQHDEHLGEERTSGLSNNPPPIDIRIDKISLTIVHELLDTKDRFPLLRGCISNVNLILQVLSTKTRVISTSSTAVYYFDAQRSLWRELLYPVAICIFYRSSSQIQDSEALSRGVPVHIHCRFSELNISLTELSLDMLLFVIGKLELAGPYSVKSSMILANCCKVENRSGLNLLCQFYNEQSLSIARNQLASVFLRNSGIANQSPEIKSVVSLQLANLGSLKTSPICISLLEAQALAWRTRIMSVEDSKTYPGPFLVVDISRKSEDGLSIVVSSLTRIHNETGFAMELRFQRLEHNDNEIASALLKSGETIDDSVAMFDAVSLSGGLKKALVSISVGNFLFSFRPEFSDGSTNSKDSLSAEWSDDLEGGKAVRLSGILDQLSYRVRKALFVGSAKCSFSTARCVLKSNGSHVASIHFLIQRIGRDVPVVSSDKFRDGFKNRDLPVALQEQKEIFLLPTIRVSNLLHTEIYVVLSETDLCTTRGYENIGKEATISCGSTCDLYANPAIIFFTVTLTAFDTSCKPVNSGDWVKKLLKQKTDAHHLDIDLDFGGGKYRATLRLSRGDRGILEAAIFTSYALKNDTDFSLYFFPPDKKSLSRDEAGKSGSNIPLELGLLVPPKSIKSWLLKSNKVQLKLLEDCASESLLDLDALSGLTEISLEVEEGSGVKYTTKLGVSMGPLSSKLDLPSQYVTMVPRYVVLNESGESITVRQCHLQDDMTGMICISSKQRKTLQLRNGVSKRTEFSLFENFIRKHRNANDDLLLYIQFRLNDSELNWSGPVCIASLGRFFLKFRKEQSNQSTAAAVHLTEFAAVHVVEEGSSLVLHFKKPPDVSLPYRIENCLQDVAITYYQKDSIETEVLEPSRSVNYVWDDLTLPHKLVVQIGDIVVREINLAKVRPWKPFYKFRQQRGLASNLFFDKSSGDQRNKFGEFNGVERVEVGYEVYADGPTRVLRISISGSHKGEAVFQSCTKIQLRVSHFAIHLLERGKQDGDESELPVYSPIIIARLGNINLDSAFTDRYKYNQISLQSLALEEKWVGAPFAAMLRRHHLDNSSPNDCVLRVDFVLLSASSNVIQVKYSSIVLQPVDLNLDEETLMRIVPFWRTSLSDSTSHSRQFYFNHFEIHPIKIFANFLPGESFSSYSSAQETLRSLLHSVVKVPPIKNKVVELNGVLVTHALITMRELCIRCAQHYSWYVMRTIYPSLPFQSFIAYAPCASMSSWRAMAIVLFFFALVSSAAIQSSESKYIAYNTTQRIVPEKINVHLVPHSHDDVGWLKTVDQYYVGANNSIRGACVQNVLDSVISALLDDKNRKFIYVEMAFFQRWWRQQSETMRVKVKELVDSGQLEFINGGMCMHDEATPHYIDLIDQTTLGHQFIKDEFDKVPRVGWQIDPFGHSAVQAYLLGAELGFDSLFFARIDYQDRAKRLNEMSLEVVWQGSKSLGSSSQIFAGIFPRHYDPPDGFTFEINDVSPPIQDDVLLFDYNVQERVDAFVASAFAQANVTRTNHIMWTMGTDFRYQYANSWFRQMDKFIHYVNEDGRVNALYSTPSIYTEAKHAANEKWPRKTDDFFPYADHPNAYWTGYFTSRPALKGYVRMMSAYYLAARQLEFFKGRSNFGPNTDALADALAIAQHHDAVSGTEREHVAADYAKRLYMGYAETEKLVSSSLAFLAESRSSRRQVNLVTNFQQCPLLNISYCPPSEALLLDEKSMVVVVYNPLGWRREEVIRIPVSSENVFVHDSDGKDIESQLLPLSNATLSIRNYYVKAYTGKSTNGALKYWLAFSASVSPLGFSTYIVSSAKQTGPSSTISMVYTSEGSTDNTIEVGQGSLKLLYSVDEGKLTRYVNSRNQVTALAEQSYSYYFGNDGTDKDPQASGAYVFRPNGTFLIKPEHQVPLTIFRGPILDEVHQQISPWISQITRVFKGKEHAEVEFSIGPIPVDDGIGKEITTQIRTTMKTNKTFYTDSNGRDFVKRVRDFRTDWDLQVNQPVAGNYFPINLGIYVQDSSKEFSVLVDRSVGGTSLVDGQIELMLHRRLLHDDSRGVGEALNETICVLDKCEGLTIQGKFYLRIDHIGEGAKWRRTVGQEIYSPLLLAFTEQDGNNWINSHVSSFSAIDPSYALPNNIAVITLQELENGKVLLRLAHLYEIGEDKDYSMMGSVEMKKLFPNRKINKVTEMSLSANQERAEMENKRLVWKVEGPAEELKVVRGGPVDPVELVVELAPMEIRTFFIDFDYLKMYGS